MSAPSEGASNLEPRRRSKRDSRIVFSLARGSVHWGLGALLLSWLVAYGLGRHARVSEAPRTERPSAKLVPLSAPARVMPPVAAETSIPAAAPAAVAETSIPAAAPAAVAETSSNAAAIEPAPSSLTIFEEAPADGFGIQIGAYPTRAEAESAISALGSELEGLDVFLISVDIPGKGTWYRVRLGHFQTRQAAEDRRKSLPSAEGALSVPYR